MVLEVVAIFVICIYGGYFGAAAGVLLLAILLRAGGATLAHANAGKNVVLGIANVVAAVVFVLSHRCSGRRSFRSGSAASWDPGWVRSSCVTHPPSR